MIKNIIFDLGRVLIDFDGEKYLAEFDLKKQEIEELNKIIFESEEWNQCNFGKYSKNTDIIDILCEKYPKYSEKIKLVLNENWVKMLMPMESSIEFLKELKKKNYKIYILSDLSEESYHFIRKYDFFECVDGGVYSFQMKMGKPNLKMYHELLNKYELNPEETIFIDDRQINIEAANKVKIHGILFRNIEQAKQEVNDLIKNQ